MTIVRVARGGWSSFLYSNYVPRNVATKVANNQVIGQWGHGSVRLRT